MLTAATTPDLGIRPGEGDALVLAVYVVPEARGRGVVDVLLGAFYISEDVDQSNQLLYGADFRNYANLLVQSFSGGALSLFGYTTKKDMSGFGSFLIMGVVGLIIAGIVNIFLKSPALYFAINGLGVLIFAGLTAYDTQRLKLTYYQLGGDENALGVATSYGALSLYLDFINLFQFLLAFLGVRRE